MIKARHVLCAALAALVVLYGAWFWREPVALLVFGLPAAALLLAALRGVRRAGFWAGVLALAWFSHGVMVAWTRPPERMPALIELFLAVGIVLAASLPGLRARFAKRD